MALYGRDGMDTALPCILKFMIFIHHDVRLAGAPQAHRPQIHSLSLIFVVDVSLAKLVQPDLLPGVCKPVPKHMAHEPSRSSKARTVA
jgi:hypothetical protein